ncbi:MAG: hypothetical protein HN350_12175 [Phycisphaerales bacterium]|jgi:hypothetical protein|nr:hypothetical protein [Phycisphaerales bacterium]
MSQLPQDGSVQVKPQSNIYTMMMIITVLVLGVAIGLAVQKMTATPDAGGYGLTIGEIFGAAIKTPK